MLCLYIGPNCPGWSCATGRIATLFREGDRSWSSSRASMQPWRKMVRDERCVDSRNEGPLGYVMAAEGVRGHFRGPRGNAPDFWIVSGHGW